MERSQWYLGVPNGVVLCVDRVKGDLMSGRYYHSYSRDPVIFQDMDEALLQMEQLFDELHFPHPGNSTRTFAGRRREEFPEQERMKIMKDEELLDMHGDLGTFIIRVQHRQNSSWQGRITWMEEDKTVCFRSVWEMIRLIAGALDTVSGPEDGLKEVQWPTDEERK